MITTLVLIVVAVFQVAFILSMLTVLFVTNQRGRRGDALDITVTASLRDPARALMLGEDQGQMLAAALEKLPGDVASRHFRSIVASQLAQEQREALAGLVRPAEWVDRILSGGSSPIWWKRMEAARLLAVTMGPSDLVLLTRLVTDRNPAVMSAAVGAIAGYADESLIELIVRRLSKCAPAVRLQQMRALRSHSELASRILVSELASGHSAQQTCALVQLAEVLGTTQALAAVVPYARDSSTEVRTTVARALRNCFTSEAVDAARLLLQDDEWRVRAAAARALAGLNDHEAVGALRRALNDESWWVRFRSALALGALGEEGEDALATAAISDDDYARDMAVVVGGLSESARLELSA